MSRKPCHSNKLCVKCCHLAFLNHIQSLFNITFEACAPKNESKTYLPHATQTTSTERKESRVQSTLIEFYHDRTSNETIILNGVRAFSCTRVRTIYVHVCTCQCAHLLIGRQKKIENALQWVTTRIYSMRMHIEGVTSAYDANAEALLFIH